MFNYIGIEKFHRNLVLKKCKSSELICICDQQKENGYDSLLIFFHTNYTNFHESLLVFDFANLPKEDKICVIFKLLELVKISAIRV